MNIIFPILLVIAGIGLINAFIRDITYNSRMFDKLTDPHKRFCELWMQVKVSTINDLEDAEFLYDKKEAEDVRIGFKDHHFREVNFPMTDHNRDLALKLNRLTEIRREYNKDRLKNGLNYDEILERMEYWTNLIIEEFEDEVTPVLREERLKKLLEK